MKFNATDIEGVWLIEPLRHSDGRGWFCETFRSDLLREHVGPVEFVQDNESMSRRGVVRGLHYQAGKSAQAKLVRVTQGRVVDVVVDLRRDSSSYGQILTAELSDDNGLQIFMPRGVAHGIVVLSDEARFQYKVDNAYDPSAERCIRFDDPDLAIAMPLPTDRLIFSEKDLRGSSFAEAEKF